MASEPIYQDVLESAIKDRYSITKFDDRNFIVGRLQDKPPFREASSGSFSIQVSMMLPEGDAENKEIIWKANQIFVCFDNTYISVGGISSGQSKILLAAPDAIEVLSKSIDDIFVNMLPLDDGS